MRCSSWATRCSAARRRSRRCRTLSLEPTHRHGWDSVYAALTKGRIEVERLRDLLGSFLPPADPLVFAVDVTTGRAATPSTRPNVAAATTPRASRPATEDPTAGEQLTERIRHALEARLARYKLPKRLHLVGSLNVPPPGPTDSEKPTSP